MMVRPDLPGLVALALLAAACGGAGTTSDADVRGKPDRPPEIAAVVHPMRPIAAGEVAALEVVAIDKERDPISYAWTDDCDGSFTAPDRAATDWTKPTPGECTIAVTVTANGLSDADSFTVAVEAPAGTGGAVVGGRFVPQPVVTEIALAGFAVSRSATDGTLPFSVDPAAQVGGTFAFDLGGAPGAWTAAVLDDCGGTPSDVLATASADGHGAGTFSWKAPGAATVCVLRVELVHETLADGFGIAVPIGL
jgi:hypothetical protein